MLWEDYLEIAENWKMSNILIIGNKPVFHRALRTNT